MPTTARTDEALMVAVRGGDRAAFETLFARYEQPIWRYFRRRVADATRAEELAQETFLAVYRGRDRYEPRATFRTYVYRIAFNLLSKDRRDAEPPSMADAGERGSDAHLDDQLWVRQALARLDPMDRTVVMLREFDELSYAEIAGVLEIPINTVRSRLFRAREALRGLLAPAAKGRVS